MVAPTAFLTGLESSPGAAQGNPRSVSSEVERGYPRRYGTSPATELGLRAAAMTIASEYYTDLRHVFEAGPPDELDEVAALIWEAALGGRVVYTLGNGASAALASHMATDLGKGTAHDHGLDPQQPSGLRLRVVSLTDNSALLTAYGNDVGYEYTFVEQLRNLLQKGDVVIGISGSGSSPNVLRAMEYARAQGAHAVGFTGNMPGWEQMATRCDVLVRAPLERIDQIEDVHVSFNHILARVLREKMHRGRPTSRSSGRDPVDQ